MIRLEAVVVFMMVCLAGGSAAGGSGLRVEKVELSGCSDTSLCGEIQVRLVDILSMADAAGDLSMLFTDEGAECWTSLRKETGFYCVNVLYEARLLNLPGGGYEVRGVRVRVEMGNTRGNPDQYLVFTFDDDLLVSDVRFAIESHHYERLLQDGERLGDFANRQKILHFIEVFRTAYNRRDIEYLRRTYSDDALIVVGRVLKVAPEQPDMLQKSLLTRDQIRFVKLSKAQYLDNLERVFDNNDFIKVTFDEVEVVRHDSLIEIYGVTLRQRWESSRYSDEGYLFLMIDFLDKDRPLIHVRTWQPEKFPDGSVISLYDFNIIE